MCGDYQADDLATQSTALDELEDRLFYGFNVFSGSLAIVGGRILLLAIMGNKVVGPEPKIARAQRKRTANSGGFRL